MPPSNISGAVYKKLITINTPQSQDESSWLLFELYNIRTRFSRKILTNFYFLSLRADYQAFTAGGK